MQLSRRRILMLATAGTVLEGCRLIDQRTFERAGQGPDAASVARSAALASGRTPLLVVHPAGLDQDWRPKLLAAAHGALDHDAAARFDIVAPVALTGAPDAANQAADDTAAVAGALQADGIDAERLHVGARSDPGRPDRAVEVYVR